MVRTIRMIRTIRMMRMATFSVIARLGAVAAALAPAGPAWAVNDQAILVLHAVPYNARQSCSEVVFFDCGSPAGVSVGPAAQTDIFLLVYQYERLGAVQCRFDWDPSWGLISWRAECASNPVHALQPVPGAGDLVIAFDVVSGPARVAPIGWLSMTSGPSGCLRIGESRYPFGTHLGDGNQHVAQIPPERRGSVCVGSGGVNGCALGADLVDSTWGSIKAGFEQGP